MEVKKWGIPVVFHTLDALFYPCPVLTPGPTHFANARIISPETAFDLFFHKEILQLILHFTNLQGQRFVHEWRDVEKQELPGYLGLLIPAAMFKSQHESTKSLWGRETGRPLFAGTMSPKRFLQINLAVRFDDKLSTNGHTATGGTRSGTCGDYGPYGAPACQKCSTQGGTYVWMNS